MRTRALQTLWSWPPKATRPYRRNHLSPVPGKCHLLYLHRPSGTNPEQTVYRCLRKITG